jgi:CRISPR/Cas system-associated exonuclease Cas4 (RecB family)
VNAPLRLEELHVSVSQVKAWLLCSRKYEFQYIIGADKEFTPMPLAFGSAFHAALGHHYSSLMRGVLSPMAEVAQRFVDSMNTAKAGPVPLQVGDDDEGTGFDDAVAKGLQMLDVTLSHPSALPAKVLAVERRFVVDLYDPTTGEILDEKLLGYFDLILEEDGHLVVVEHKTSAKRYSLDQLINDTQLGAYAFAAGQMGWGEVGLRFSVTTKTKTPVLQIEDVRRDDGDQSDFLRQAVGVLKAIDAGISFPLRSWACKSCPYKSRCQAER